MTAGAPWSVKGIDPKAREIAKDLARRSGMTLGEWLNQMILEDGPEEVAPQLEPRRRAANLSDRPAAPIQRLQAEAAEEDDIARVAEALDRLSARIEAAEHRSTLAISGIDQSVVGVLSRIESAEREQNQVAARFEGAIDEVRSDTDTIESRLRDLEKARTGARSAEALKSLESALSRVATHLYEGEGRTRDSLGDLKRDVDDLADRVRRNDDVGGQAALVDMVVARIVERLEQAEARTTGALKGLEGSFASLDQRLGAAEARIGEPSAQTERRFEQLAADLTQRVEQVRGELAEKLTSTTDSRFDRMEGALREMNRHVQAAEHRSAEAIDRMGKEVVRMTDTLNHRVQSVEARSAESIDQVGGDIARMADAMEGRMKRADTAQAAALEKLGTEIARITERLAERIASAERRSAQSMDDVGEQMARVTDRLHQRQERASSELVDRMRQSEERTAKILEDARDKIDQRLVETQKRLAEQAPAPTAGYGDPFSSASFGAPAFGAPSAGPAADPFGAHNFTGQDFASQDFATEDFAAQDDAPQTYGGQAFAQQGRAAQPYSVQPAAPPAFSTEDTEAAFYHPDDIEDEPADEFVGVAEPSAAFIADEVEPIETLDAADLEPDHRATAFDDGFDDAFDAAVDDVDTPEAPPLHPRNASTRDLIANARAAARAASQPQDAKTSRKGSGGKAREQRETAPFFSGFGLGRKKAKAENATLKTALLMSAAAAFLGIGAAGIVLTNGGGAFNASDSKDAPPAVPSQTASAGAPTPEAADPAPLDPRLALALSPSAAAAPTAPPAEAEALYSTAVAQIEGGDVSGVEALRRSANLGYAPAQYYLSNLYADGKAGLKKDAVEARRWTERAAANGEPRAMHSLATFYYYGEGGPQNAAAAVDWFKKAANLGWVDSEFNLAVLYEKGLGVRQNAAEAYKWYLIAGRRGDEPSRAKAVELKKLLSPSELLAADRAALTFRAETPNPSTRAAALTGSPPALGGADSNVSAAQRALARLGYYQGPADGVSSPALRLAIAAYQRDQGLSASGSLTPELVQRFVATR